ncbi:MAG: imidazole glycerol phosphate synthase subunit HisH [Clostridiales bacterium]|mgnify:CR=1 FL=1|nr:imidazole glycerol phosphate synthase subunit HisH [Clostridiales bacterium]
MSMKIGIIDYGAGNLFSVKNALSFIGVESAIISDKVDIEKADALILPGVGAFGDSVNMLREKGLFDSVKANAVKKPFLGICLGMQLLFTKSYEYGETKGLDLISGDVVKMESKSLSIPHMGWNELEIKQDSSLLKGLEKSTYVYFVHSYMARCDEANIIAECDYGGRVPAIVKKGNVFGVQFHPEKSGDAGLVILKNFAELV